ncbi:MAG TPA: hypothetical protein VKX41_21675 [Alloacidobacterium sp.]|nr:hypothetical protein [Alloacidobacterium sp.]
MTRLAFQRDLAGQIFDLAPVLADFVLGAAGLPAEIRIPEFKSLNRIIEGTLRQSGHAKQLYSQKLNAILEIHLLQHPYYASIQFRGRRNLLSRS